MTSTANNLRGVLKPIKPTEESVIKLRNDATILGREKGDVIISDSEASSTHCQIQFIDGSYHIFDMNSTNGTYVNNEKIIKAILSKGDQIKVGKHVFEFSLEEEKKVRHISTIFKSPVKNSEAEDMVSTLIERELKKSNSHNVKIHIRYSNGKEETVHISSDNITIGRTSTFGSFDQDTQMSRKHMTITVNSTGDIFIEDQGSTNGSYINGKKVTGMHQITGADTVKVGGCTLRITLD